MAVTNLVKLAYELKDHQKRVSNKIDQGGNVLAYHSLGSGKTLTSLDAAVKKIQAGSDKVQFVVPAPLRENILKEIKKHGIPDDVAKKIDVVSYEKASKNPDKYAESGIDLLVLDEAHRIRNTGTARSAAVKKLIGASKQRLFLTGTPIYNQRNDIAPLINGVAGQKIMPEDINEFDNKYIERIKKQPGFIGRVLGVEAGDVTTVKNKKQLREIGQRYMDKYDAQADNPEDFPTRIDKTVDVPMGDKQYETYKYLEGDIPFHIRWKISHNLPMSKKESKDLNAFVTGVRQASNTNAAYLKDPSNAEGTKIDRILQDVKERHGDGTKGHKGVVYSTYLTSGLKQLSEGMAKHGIKHEVFDGSLTDKARKAMVARYNSGETPWLLVSSSGTEGLDLLETKSMHVMEPHFNQEKINQFIGRGIRYKSHEKLPVDERKVEVIRYQATRPKAFFGTVDRGTSIDQYLYQMSDNKSALHKALLDAMTS